MADELRASRIGYDWKPGDNERVKDLLDELIAFCKIRECVIAHTAHGIVLAKYRVPPQKCRIIAVIRNIGPNDARYLEASGDLIGDDVMIHIPGRHA